MNMSGKEFKITEEIEAKEGYIKDPVSGKLVRATPERVEAKLVFAERLLKEYGYSAKQIRTFPEFYIQKGANEKVGPADIVVFNDQEQTQDNIFLIVETKRKDRRDGVKQLKSYVYPTPAEGAVWFNGTDIAYLRVLRKPPSYRPELVEWRNIPRKGQKWDDIGKHKSVDDLIPDPNLKSTFKTIYYHLYTNSNLPRAERLGGEMTRLIFCKIYDEMNNSRDLQFRAGVGETDRGVADRIKKIFEEVKQKAFGDVFDKDEKLLLDDKSIGYLVNELQNKGLLKTDKDAVGDAFEVFIGPGLRGEKGQFFTPRNVVRMAIEMLDPQHDERIIDPACGSGGFLIVALEHVWADMSIKYGHLSEGRIGEMKANVASSNFFGIDKEFDLAKVSKAYMAIVGDGRGGVFCADSLDISNWAPLIRDKIKDSSFDVLVTNPPFGAKIPITDQTLLQHYNLGHKWKKDKTTGEWIITNKVQDKQVPQILFIERCLQLLKPGGRMGIVLPDGILGNISDGYIRTFIRQEARILAVVDCPPETFQPSTSTKTSMLFLQKKDRNEQETDYPIFMAVAEKCGHDRRGKPIYGEDGRLGDDLPKVVVEFKRFRKKHDVDF